MTKARDRHVTCVRSSVDPETGVSETVAAILEAHRAGTQSPAETVARTFARIAAHADPAMFISLRQEAEAVADARALADKRLPLYGVPVAVKDNIDVAGLPTTAACPAFAYQPARDAAAVARLQARRRDRHRQDQPRPVRDRPRRHALALWRAAQSVRPELSPGRLELGLGGRGRAPASCRSRSAPTRPDRAACRPGSTTSSG